MIVFWEPTDLLFLCRQTPLTIQGEDGMSIIVDLYEILVRRGKVSDLLASAFVPSHSDRVPRPHGTLFLT